MLLAKVKELGDDKVTVTQADIILLLHEIFGEKENGVKLVNYEFALKKGAPPQGQPRTQLQRPATHGAKRGRWTV